MQKPKKFKSKIICVGNATVGGAGKTPLVLKIYQLLKNNNKRIAFIAKGYKGELLKKYSVIKVDKTKHNANETLS